MDTAISDGDFLKSSNGQLVAIEGLQELIQRALIRLSVKKGSFLYDKNLGSELYKLKASYVNGITLQDTAMQMVNEALEPIKEVKAQSISLKTTNLGERLLLSVILICNDIQTELEVSI